MNPKIDHLPVGWRPMAEELLRKAEREFPGIDITDISAKRGWLSVDFDRNTVRVPDYWRATKLCEAVGSTSWHVCVECGSHYGAQRPGHVMPICDDCLN
ncbi:MAG: hypothetical protein DI546_01290 [Rhizobium sp.]|nr:MAG: hypothetical protein DI546_01290 [Rhizobium sp.]